MTEQRPKPPSHVVPPVSDLRYKYSYRIQAYTESQQQAGVLMNVTEIIVAANSPTEAEAKAEEALGSRRDGRKMRIASVVEFGAEVR